MTPDTYRMICQMTRQAYESGAIDRVRATDRMNKARDSAMRALASNEIDPRTKLAWAGISFAMVDETAMLDI